MNQRIAIDTPNGTVYLGEECEFRTDKNGWNNRALTHMVAIVDGETKITMKAVPSWYFIKDIRPIQPKKMRPMNKAELVQLVLKGAEFFHRDGRSVVFPPVYTLYGIFNVIGWSLDDDVTHYTLPNDPTKRKLGVEE